MRMNREGNPAAAPRRREWGGRRFTAGAASLALLSLMALAGCSHDSPSTGKNAAGYEGDAGPQLFSVPAEQMSHVQVVTVQPTDLPRVLRLTGSVAFNGFRTTPVITQMSGPVRRIVVSPGEFVRRGQPMLYLSSPDFSQLRANYIKARDAHALAHKTYVRSQDLYAHHAIAERDLQAAESAEIQAQADLEAGEQALRIIGVSNPETLSRGLQSPEVPLLAPISGEVVERLVAPGQVVQASSTQCFTISDMKTVWVLANVYQNQLEYVHVGDPVSIQTDAFPTVFHGRISYLAAELDPASRTLQARIETDNPGEKLKKDMYVTAIVRAGMIKQALAVPDASVLRNSENEPFVYVARGQGQFAQRLVTVGESQNGMTQVLAGLKSGEQVVGDGSLFLQFANSLQR